MTLRKYIVALILIVLLAVLAGNLYRGAKKEDSKAPVAAPVQKTEPAPPAARLIAAGGHHAIALMSNGSVWKWGGGIYSEVGFSSAVPSGVGGLSDVAAISAGASFNMALKKDGTVWAWGSNGDGQFGNGTTNHSDAPVQLSGLMDIIAISSGEKHTAALNKDGTVWTWGYNGLGQLGIGKKSHHERPSAVSGSGGAQITDAIGVAAGGGHTLMLRKDGTVWAWGNNRFGQLGDGTNEDRYSPVQVSGLSDVIAVACGYAHSIAIRGDGTVWTWGNDSHGQLGDGTEFKIHVKTKALSTAADAAYIRPEDMRKSVHSVPVRVMGIEDVVSVSGGREYTLSLKKDGTVWAWGDNYYGQLGNPGVRKSPVPLQVQGIKDVTSITAGYDFGGAIRNDGTAWTWGYNIRGQLGNGTKAHRSIPALAGITPRKDARVESDEKKPPVPFPSNIIAVAAGGYHSIALGSDGTVWTWGNNAAGQLGDGTTENSAKPIPVKGITDAIAISGGYAHTLALKKDGTVWAWGHNSSGQLGDGTTTFRAVPVQVRGLSYVRAISGGGYHSVALKQDGSVWAWGNNEYGQLGNGGIDDSHLPVQVKGIRNAAAVAAGGHHTVAAGKGGIVRTWGNNSFGQLGDGTTVDRATPVQVTGIDAAEPVICAGANHTAALRTWNGKVWTWGAGEFGQLGDGSLENKASPVLVQLFMRGMTEFNDRALTGIISIACGGDHMIALMNGGGLRQWGRGNFGQKGGEERSWDNSTYAVGYGAGDTAQVAAGYEHSIVLSKDGKVRTWGSNEYGQLGDPAAYDSENGIQVK